VTDLISGRSLYDDLFDIPETPGQKNRLLDVLDKLAPAPPRNDHFPKDPVKFMREVIGIEPWQIQEDIVYSVWENRYTSVASCHGIGKSFITAAILITFVNLKENSIVLSTAPTGRQVEHVLWRNVRHLYATSLQPLLGNKPLTTRYDIAESWYAMGFKPTDSDTDPIQGFHAEEVLCIVDEAAGAMPTIIDGMMAALTTEQSRMLLIGNPTSTAGPFYESHHGKKHQYKTFKVAWPDTPNYKAGRTILPYLITEQWVDDVVERYGEESPYVQARVYANWVSSEDVLIPQNSVINANERTMQDMQEWAQARADAYMDIDWDTTAGLDVARDGKDETILTVRTGPVVMYCAPISGSEGWEVAGKTLKTLKDNFPECSRLCIDEVGVGASVLDFADRLVRDFEEFKGLDIVGVNFGKTPHDPEKYKNQRCEAYGLLADRFRTGAIGGNGFFGDEAVADLSDIHYTFDGRHSQPLIEPKERFKERNGHSPDYGDSIALAFYEPPPDDDIVMGALAFGYAEQRWGKIGQIVPSGRI
jgi:phage terminase large subunit